MYTHRALSRPAPSADAFDELRQQNRLEAALMPCIGGLTTGVLALGYPEILYQVRIGCVQLPFCGSVILLLALGYPEHQACIANQG